MSSWERLVFQVEVQACRRGWKGVVDAVKSAVTCDPRVTAPVTMTLSGWVKNETKESIVTSVKLDIKEKK